MIRVDGLAYCIDPAGGIADALGKKWTLPLIGILGNRPKNRFHELLRGLEGVGAKALSDRLRELQGLGIVSREAFAEVPTRVEYRLTAKGLALRRALVPLLEWAAREEGTSVAPAPAARRMASGNAR
jgi:DNA-binding HxlR family transcriptional regulator